MKKTMLMIALSGSALTAQNESLAVVVSDKILSTPTVRSVIADGKGTLVADRPHQIIHFLGRRFRA